MPIEFTCPFCGAQTNVADQYAGQTGPCSKCGQQITIPGAPFGAGATMASHVPTPRKSSTAWIVIPIIAGVLVVVLACGGVLTALMLPAIQAAREAARRVQCSNNLRQIALAMQNYHDAYGQYPPAYIADENGKPMHSWRVLLLPYLEENNLYGQYNFDEPWDSPHNRSVMSYTPSVFRCPSSPSQGGSETDYVMVVGPGCISDGPNGCKMESIKDGTSDTIMIVEIANSNINWAEPRDLDATTMSYHINDPSGQLCISSNHPYVANVALADGSVHALSDDTDPKIVREMVHINNGAPDWSDIP